MEEARNTDNILRRNQNEIDRINGEKFSYYLTGINPKYTFDYFELWPFSQNAVDECKDFLIDDDFTKGILYVVGEHGSGKTTLLQCLGNLYKSLKKLDKSVDVVIIDSLSFIDEKATDRKELVKGIKEIATQFGCVVIVVYQVKHILKDKDIAKSLELVQLDQNNEVDNILLLTSDIPAYFRADLTITKTSSSKDGMVSLAYNPFLQEFKSL